MDPLKSLNSYLEKNAYTMPDFSKAAPVKTPDLSNGEGIMSKAPVGPVRNPNPAPANNAPVPTNTNINFNNDANFNSLLNFLKTQNQPITSSTLSTPSTPTGADTTKNNTIDSTGLGSDLTAMTLTAEQQRLADEKKKADESAKAVTDYLAGTQGETGLTDQAYKDAGVDTAQAEYNRLNAEMVAEQVANRRRIEQIEKNAGGMFGGAVQQEVDRANRQSISKQADIAVLQLAAQNNYFGAKAIADRAVALKMEEDTRNLDILERQHDEYKELFTKDEERQYQESLDAKKSAIKLKETELQTISDLSLDALSNGAPTDIVAQMRQAKTADEAIKIGGQYVGKYDRLLKESQLAKANKELRLLGEPSAKEIAATKAQMEEAVASIQVAQDKIDAVDILKGNSGLNNRVGVNFLSRIPVGSGFFGTVKAVGQAVVKIPATGVVGSVDDFLSQLGPGKDFAGGIHKLVSGLTLDELIAAKARGATFGALSEGELGILADSATAINDWEIKDKDGKGIGVWDIDEASFNREMDNIQMLTRRALVKSQGKLLSTDESNALDELYTADTPVSSYY